VTWNTLLAYVSGEASLAEQQACHEWLAAHPNNQALYQRLLEQHRQRRQPVPPAEVTHEWEKLQARLQSTPSEAPERRLPDQLSWSRLAAVLLLLIVATVLLWQARAHFFQASAPTWTTVSAAAQRRLVHLPDGSTVWLARRSRLSYPADFGQHRRSVRIRGAAFFEVQKNPAKPFVVSTPELTVQVLGTSFQVLARANTTTEVAVATGVVVVQAGATRRRLYPGQRLAYDSLGRAQVVPVALAAARSLKTDTLHFERSSLRQIAQQLSSWYGLPVYLAPGDTSRVAFSGRIADAGLPQVLAGLAFATDHTYKLTSQHTIVIQAKAKE